VAFISPSAEVMGLWMYRPATGYRGQYTSRKHALDLSFLLQASVAGDEVEV
jgi:hypothetical protein